jgi:hypothetical protein
MTLAIFNNCGLYAVTNEIIEQIGMFGNDHPHVTEYTELKDAFASYYGFEQNKCSWRVFQDLLKGFDSNDIQIIMGSVLRQFMAVQLNKNEDLTSELRDEWTLIQSDGLYYSLSPDVLAAFVYKPLGFSLAYVKDDKKTTIECDKPNSEIEATITIYHNGNISDGHWERNNSDDEVKGELAYLMPLFRLPNPANQYGLMLLKEHVRIAMCDLNKNYDSKKTTQEFLNLKLTALQIAKYVSDISYVSGKTATKLLGSGLTAMTKKFINDCPLPNEDKDPLYETFVTCDLNDFVNYLERYEIVQSLQKYPVVVGLDVKYVSGAEAKVYEIEKWLKENIPRKWKLGMFRSADCKVKQADNTEIYVPKGIYEIKNYIERAKTNSQSASATLAGVQLILASKMTEIDYKGFFGFIAWLFSGRSQDTEDRYKDLNQAINPKISTPN